MAPDSSLNNSRLINCLGKEFNSEEERREHYRNELRNKLPDLKKLKAFLLGKMRILLT